MYLKVEKIYYMTAGVEVVNRCRKFHETTELHRRGKPTKSGKMVEKTKENSTMRRKFIIFR
jgi:hypothetical protein